MGLRDPLTAQDVAARLRELDGWTGDTSRICKTFDLDYFTSVQVIAELARAAKELEHHPDIDLRWQTLLVSMTTYSAGGVVTELDFKLARRVDAVIGQHGQAASEG
jgi:4a-hydroxytetrahydrobiopterin dehydratase